MSELSTLSVILPNYNHAQYVESALQALVDQSMPAREIIVIDDGSTDDSVQVIEKFATQYPSVRLLRNDRNRGVVAAINRGIQSATSEFLYFGSADDLVLPGFFEHSLQLLARFPDARISFTDQNFIDDRTGIMTPKHVAISPRPDYVSPEGLVESLRRIGDSIGSSGTLIHRKTLMEIGCFPDELRWHSDWFLTLVIAFRYGACYVPKPLTAFRIRAKSYSDGARSWREQRKVLDELLTRLRSLELADVAHAFYASRVLSNFGFQIVRAAVLDHHPALRILPYWRILWREVKNLLIRVGPMPIRRAFWDLRYRWRTSG